ADLGVVTRMLSRNLNCVGTSSAGRLFDGVCSLLGLRQTSSFEGQAAMALEFALGTYPSDEAYPLPVVDSDPPAMLTLDWRPTIKAILADLETQTPLEIISARFHNALAESILRVAKRLRVSQVVLSGGGLTNR